MILSVDQKKQLYRLIAFQVADQHASKITIIGMVNDQLERWGRRDVVYAANLVTEVIHFLALSDTDFATLTELRQHYHEG